MVQCVCLKKKKKKNPKLWNVNSFTGGMRAYMSHVPIYSSVLKVNMVNTRLQTDVLYLFWGKRQAQNVIFYPNKVTNTLIKKKSTVSKE